MRLFTALTVLLYSVHIFAQQPAPGVANCPFSFKPDSIKINWTGYKFTEKKGAKGEFKDFKVSSSTTAKTAEELILSTSVDIDTLRVDSGDPGRDSNLREFFFKKMKGLSIKGVVASYNPAILKIKTTMNGVTKVLAFRVTVDGNKYLAETDFDVLDFKMKKSYEALSKACNDLHKGPDGKTKTWTQVSLSLSAEIEQKCAPTAAQ